MRRLLVFGVAALGVASLYLVPGLARSPYQVAAPRASDEPTARPSRSVSQDVSVPSARRPRSTTSPSTSAGPTERAGDERSAPTGADPDGGRPEGAATADRTDGTDGSDPSTAPPPARPSRTGATAFDPAEARDDEPPAPVAEVSSAVVTPSRLTVRWPAAADNVGVVQYTVLLDGFAVATTPETSATVPWFNDGARDHVVQVRAADAAGNQSPSSPTLLVARPTPEPTAEPSATTPGPGEPTADPSDPTAGPTESPAAPTPAPGEEPSSAQARPGDVASSGSPTDEEN